MSRGHVAETLEPSDFVLLNHQAIYRAMVRLAQRGAPTAVKLVAEELGVELDEAGGVIYLVSIAGEATLSMHLSHYIDVVQEAARARAVGEAAEWAIAQSSSPSQAIDGLRERLDAIERLRRRYNWDDRQDALDALVQRLTAPPTDETAPVFTGMSSLDYLLGGLRRKHLITIGARTGVGKTSMAVSIAHHVAQVQRQPVAFFSLEMGQDEIWEKFASIESGIPWSELSNDMGEIRQKRVRDGIARLRSLPLFVIECPSATPAEIHRTAREIDLRFRLGLVVVDYLQFVHPTKPRESRVQDVSAVARDLKTMAVELAVPVLVPAQLNRQVEYRGSSEPTLADLKDSGEIEQTSNIVILLSRIRDAAEGEEPPVIEQVTAHVAKNRMGKRGKVTLEFDGAHMQFGDLGAWPQPF